ncbi:MAG: DUF2236 domain-containing protein [Actinobacteria bacterium]|nr:DUF2236 domain-containing protein [Actinomycetota bacterium]MCB9390587.1 DUF2236 domain-containing protein [Acidimicrobiia bacterium]
MYTLPLPKNAISRRINLEPVIMTGGGRAVVMQVAHPSVAAGVANFSDYRTDPWNRLFRTLDVMFKLAFGTPEQSLRQQKILAARHRRVEGENELGERYNAMDPALLVWVWATLVDTSVLVYDNVYGELRPDQKERFYQEQKAVAVGCHTPIDAIPPNWDAFRAYWDDVVANDLHVTQPAMDVMRASMAPPLPRPLDKLSGASTAVTIYLLPESVREQFGLRLTPRMERAAKSLFSKARLARYLPQSVRHAPAMYQVRRKRPIHVKRGTGAMLLSKESPARS